MEYQTGVKKKDTLEITELLNAKTGEAVKVNGAVHTTVSYTHLTLPTTSRV